MFLKKINSSGRRTCFFLGKSRFLAGQPGRQGQRVPDIRLFALFLFQESYVCLCFCEMLSCLKGNQYFWPQSLMFHRAINNSGLPARPEGPRHCLAILLKILNILFLSLWGSCEGS